MRVEGCPKHALQNGSGSLGDIVEDLGPLTKGKPDGLPRHKCYQQLIVLLRVRDCILDLRRIDVAARMFNSLLTDPMLACAAFTCSELANLASSIQCVEHAGSDLSRGRVIWDSVLEDINCLVECHRNG